MAAAIAEADAEALAAALAAEGRATVQLDGAPVEVLPEEVIVSERPREGWSVVNEQGETVALDLEITPELRRAGLAREVIRAIQEARKGGGFEVSDRITLSWAVLDPDGTSESSDAMAAGNDRASRPDRLGGARLHDHRGRVTRGAGSERPRAGPGLHRLPDLRDPHDEAGVPR